MKTNKQITVRNNVLKLKMDIYEAIDNLCQKSDFKLTYAEINSALTEILHENLGRELKILWSEECETENQ